MKAHFSSIALAGLALISGLGLFLACGHLVTIPLIQAQLAEAAPRVEEAIEEAASVSRRRSFYGLIVCAPIFLLSLSALAAQRRRSRATEPSSPPNDAPPSVT